MEFNNLNDAIRFSKTCPLSEIVAPASSVVFKSARDMEVIKRHFIKDGIAHQEAIQLECPNYLLQLIIKLLTKKPTAYPIISAFSPDLFIKSINEIIQNTNSNLYLAYLGKILMTMVPLEYSYLPNEFVLSGFINNTTRDNFVSALVCDKTRFIRAIYTIGDPFKTVVGNTKWGVCIINSEVGIIDPKKLGPTSIIGLPCIWYEDKRMCAILPSKKYPTVSIRQINKKRSDILFDFMVELELRKIHEAVSDVHNNMLVNKLSEEGLRTIKSMMRGIDPNINKRMKVLYEKANILDIYLNVLNMASLYSPQYKVKLERAAGLIYSMV